MKLRQFFAAAVASALCAATANAGYRVVSATKTDLGTLREGIHAEAYDINNRGQIVGASTDRTGVEQAFMYDGGVMFDLTTSVGPTLSRAHGINRHGTVVGFFLDGALVQHAFRWDGGVLTPLVEPPSTYRVSSVATAVNDSGYIVGLISYSDLSLSVATMWTDAATSFSLDPALEADRLPSYATDVDAIGHATGYDLTSHRGWLWKPFDFGDEQMPPPRAPPVDGYILVDTKALGVHKSSGVVGTATYRLEPDGSRFRAVYWNAVSSRSVDLGTFPGGNSSAADDINDEGFITGWSELPVPSTRMTRAAFLFHKSFGMYLLPIDKGTACQARALNDRKENGLIQVVGVCYWGGIERAIRWDVMVEWVP